MGIRGCGSILLVLIMLCSCRQPPQKPAPRIVPELTVNRSSSQLAIEEDVASQPPPGVIRRTRPPTTSSRPKRDPFASRMQPKATPTPTPKLAPAKKSPNKKAKVPSFIPKTDYPVYKAEIIASNETAGSGSKILGVPGEALDRNAARPLYHPAVVSQRHSDYPWLDVRFELRADASFEVYLISSTGDPVFDQIALQTLRSWKWKPKTVRGRPVASTELVRLTKH